MGDVSVFVLVYASVAVALYFSLMFVAVPPPKFVIVIEFAFLLTVISYVSLS